MSGSWHESGVPGDSEGQNWPEASFKIAFPESIRERQILYYSYVQSKKYKKLVNGRKKQQTQNKLVFTSGEGEAATRHKLSDTE